MAVASAIPLHFKTSANTGASSTGIGAARTGAFGWAANGSLLGRRSHCASTTGCSLRDAAVAGLGIALLATFLLQTPLKKRTLKVLDIGAEAEGATIYIAYPEHLRSSGKIRALTAWIQQSIGDPAYWDADSNR
jgi:DNA-binding transcriptional LysR family regulator